MERFHPFLLENVRRKKFEVVYAGVLVSSGSPNPGGRTSAHAERHIGRLLRIETLQHHSRAQKEEHHAALHVPEKSVVSLENYSCLQHDKYSRFSFCSAQRNLLSLRPAVLVSCLTLHFLGNTRPRCCIHGPTTP